MPEYSTVQHGTVLGSGGVACERCGPGYGCWGVGGRRAEGLGVIDSSCGANAVVQYNV